MLTSPDRELVHRDRAIPGLSVALDPAAVLESLRRFLPTVAGPVQPVYLLYKPGVSCLAAYRLRRNGQPVDVHVRAYRLDSPAKLSARRRRSQSAEQLPYYSADINTVFSVFPEDRRIPSLSRLDDSASCKQLLERLFPGRPELWTGQLERLRYKPERRYVARLWASGSPAVLLKFHTASAYPAAKTAIKRLQSRGTLTLAQRVGHSDRHSALAVEWLPGELLWERMADEAIGTEEVAEDAARVGLALATLHGQSAKRLRRISRQDEADGMRETAKGISQLCPQIAAQATRLGGAIAERLLESPPRDRAIHGDFYAGQVLVQNPTVALLDLDEAACGDPAADLGNFLAHLERGVLTGSVAANRAESIGIALREGYASSGGGESLERVGLYAAAGLVRLAPHAFRSRAPNWPAQMAAILARAEETLDQSTSSAPRHRHASQSDRPPAATSVVVDDPFGLRRQPETAFLAGALDPAEAAARLGPLVAKAAGIQTLMQLRAIRVTRLKPQRRCLIEYDWQPDRESSSGAFTTVAKVRMKGLDGSALRLLESLWEADFHGSKPDGIYVPAPVGAVAEWRMWLQCKAPGTSATELFQRGAGVELARRVADAIAKLHRYGPPPDRRHTMADELRILHERLPLVARSRADLAGRLDRLLDGCERLGAESPTLPSRPIHRDFYADHVLVDGDRLCLLDMDLYCAGDPALDVGNFCAHLTEQSLRIWQRPDALADCEQALTDRYVELTGEDARLAVQAYATLTLVRHVHISTLIPQRRSLTELLCELCEHRLAPFRRRRARVSPAGQ